MAQVQDDAFHEIQLNGKQLVFLFMAATVVSVVIFLCGVLVGRGVRAERATMADASAAAAAEPVPQQPEATPSRPPAGSDPTAAAAPPPAADDLSYFSRLEKKNTPAERLKAPEPAAAAKAAAPPPAAPAPAPAEKPVANSRSAAERPASAEPAGQGYAVQIAALNVRSEADAIAKRLTSKGYAAYVVTPQNGSPSVFRVRVGKFGTRREAESVAARLQKEEQFKPWIVR